ncbi:MAG: rhodanese-like domain-containing protein [Phycisphaerales bacterium]|nr:rhodanese-like domain-containing protein [Phycisphaerales bacterium]
MRSNLSVLGLVLAVAFCGCQQNEGISQKAKVQRLKTASELKSKMDAGSITVVHALDAEHYAKGHIPGAQNIDYEKMTPDMLPEQKDQPIVFYCSGGMCPVGRMAASKAAKWGYTDVWEYHGGIKDWKRAGMPVEKGP